MSWTARKKLVVRDPKTRRGEAFLEALRARVREPWDTPKPFESRFAELRADVETQATASKLALLEAVASTLREGEMYLEIGSWKGATVIAAAGGKPDAQLMAVDNFSQFGGTKEALLENLARYGVGERVQVIEADGNDVLRKSLAPVGGYFFDGSHTYISQYLALELGSRHLADGAIVVVDDTRWAHVYRANRDYVRTHPRLSLLCNMPSERMQDDRWWNGVQVFEYIADRPAGSRDARFWMNRVRYAAGPVMRFYRVYYPVSLRIRDWREKRMASRSIWDAPPDMPSGEQMPLTTQDELDFPQPATVAEALAIHHARSEGVLASGDSNAIKELYVELGALLESAVGTDVGSVPLLSYPEIAPVVAVRLRDHPGFVLDAGCGPLPTLSLMLGAAAPSSRIVAMDISIGIVRLARTRAALGGVAVLGVVGDLERLPFRDRVFSGAGCEDTIEHVPDDRVALQELARVLAPRGRLVLTTPNRRRFDVLRRRLSDALRRTRMPAPAYYAATSHVREYTWRQMVKLVRTWFVIHERTTVDWSGNYRARVASRLVRFRPLRFASRMIVLVLESKRPAGT